MSSPVPMFGTQNLKDDDGPVIDSFFIETDNPPNMETALEPVPAPPKENPPRPDRLLTGTFTVSQGGFTSPVMVLPADANRKSLTLAAMSAAATATFTDFVLISDENGIAGNPTGAFRLRPIQGAVFMDGYTGAIWAFPGASITATIELTWVAVTR